MHQKAKGVDTVACMAVNDAFVMSRWIKSLEGEDKVTMLADGGAAFAEASGLVVKTGNFGGPRLNRLAMIVSLGPSFVFDHLFVIGSCVGDLAPYQFFLESNTVLADGICTIYSN